jgi:S-DNA-T family DNA segregation ATPase FtsK/SpoIIIE
MPARRGPAAPARNRPPAARAHRGARAPAPIWPRLDAVPPALLHFTRAYGPTLLAVLCVAGGAILGLALAFPGGSIAAPLNALQGWLLGWSAPLVAVWLVGSGLGILWWRLHPERPVPWRRLLGAVVATVALVALAGCVDQVPPEAVPDSPWPSGGGLVGLVMARTLAEALGAVAAAALVGLVLLAGALLLMELAPLHFARGVVRGVRAGVRGGVAVARTVTRALAWVGTRLRGLRRTPPAALEAAEPGLPERMIAKVRRPRSRPAAASATPVAEAAADAAPAAGPLGTPSPRSPWRLPPLALLQRPTSPALAPVDLQQRARIIEETLESFHIGARVAEINEGPTVTQFGIEPAPGVTVSRITARTNDLALRLGASTLRIEAPVPGKRVVGIEVPNAASAVVTLREILAAPEFERLKSHLGLALGRDVAGRPVAGDLARMPHLLIAGATGSGKSVCINGIIACLLMQCTPDDLQLLLVDPKMVELAPFEGIPHLRLPVVTEMDKVVGVLKWALQEMERRYALFVKYGVRNLESFNRLASSERPTPPSPLPEGKGEADTDMATPPLPFREGGPGGVGPMKPLPYLVIVIDELADLMMTAPDDVELSLTRLAQKARATGIHLVVATQRPSVDVVTGLIKANFPTRIAFAVTSQVDSRVILDTVGAEKLLGRGDMLYLPAESSKPMRVQCTYLSDAEIETLVAFWRKQGEAQYDAADVAAVEALGNSDGTGEDLIERAVDVVHEHKRVSVSLLQRRLGIGYPRAARLMDALADRGLVEATEDGRAWVATGAEPTSVEAAP